MKRLLSLFLGCLMALLVFTGYAQSTQITTLMSGDDVKVFFGPQSFKDAVAAANDGDVLTLSAGIFDAPSEIEKSLTVRGAGMGLEKYRPYVAPTVINGAMDLEADLNFESLRFNSILYMSGGYECTFCKCWIYELDHYMNNTNKHVNLIQSEVNLKLATSKLDLFAVNSVLSLNNNNSGANGVLLNCYVNLPNSLTGTDAVKNTTFSNCIIRVNSSSYPIEATNSTFYNNCLFYGKNGGKSFDNVKINGTCFGDNTIEKVFKEDGYYELLDEYASLKGTDGNQIGIYGGNLGFDITPNNPQITRFSVAPKTSVDGKLSIELEVKGAE